MKLMELLGRQLLFFDGAMGTRLHEAGLPAGTEPDRANLTMPAQVQAIHSAYLRAGCHLLKTNTFVTNGIRLADAPYGVAEIVEAAVAIARAAIDEVAAKGADAGGALGPHFIALDVGPTGKLLAPMGDLDFEDAVSLFAEVVRAGARAGVDCVLIETMSDVYELKAAVLAAKECGLPVLATVTVDAQGKLLTGGDMRTVGALLEGLRVDAVGLNCGFGAEAMLPHLKALRAACGLPLIVNPNAGLPEQLDGRTVYRQTPEMFAGAAELALEAGACVLGGCCGTTPAHIGAMAARLAGRKPKPAEAFAGTVVTSGAVAVAIDGAAPVLIGERINPTGKPAMKRALAEGSVEYMLREAVRQQEAGARILDINAGLPGIDEAVAIVRIMTEVQAVSDLPLQLDTADPGALEAALRRYNGKAMINSVNGKRESMETVFPLAARYGGVIVGLTLDEGGIPATAQGRVDIAARILAGAARYGIDRRDIVIDPLTMAVSAEPDAACVALEALRRIRGELGVQTVLGVSNVSFGLPRRGVLNAAFFTLAVGAGLSAAIINPYAAELMQAYHALCALLGHDVGCAGYIGAMQDAPEAAQPSGAGGEQSLGQAVRRGLRDAARAIAGTLAGQMPPLQIVETELIPALNDVGADFERGRVFLPQLLMSAEAAKAAFEALSVGLTPQERGGKGVVVIATVQGDIHDIGKNIARAMLENYRYDVVDLGRDVPPERVVEAVRQHGAKLVGLSALMTTTVTSMERTIALLHREVPDCRVMAGGAVLSAAYAEQIGADRYVRDAMDSVRYAQAVLG